MADRTLDRGELARAGLVAATLAFAGLPIYINAPRYYAAELAVPLPALGAALLAVRAVDGLQEPLIGWLADRWRLHREAWALGAIVLLATGFATVFAFPAAADPLPRLVFGLLLAFTGFSALQIALYDHGVAMAHAAGGGHTRIALWREVGGLLGVLAASLAPALIAAALGASRAFTAYAVLFAALALVGAWAMRGRWRASRVAEAGASGFRLALTTPGVPPLLLFALLNAMPTAVTATLFLFFVEHALDEADLAGPLLLAFFASAAAAAPFWVRLADAVGRRVALACSMSLSILAFAWAYWLGPGDAGPFLLIALASGAALGADMTLAPAMLAARVEGDGGRAFALWTFTQKTALAVAAGLALPALAYAGFDPQAPASPGGRHALSVAYALVPCALKLLALTALLAVPRPEEMAHEKD